MARSREYSFLIGTLLVVSAVTGCGGSSSVSASLRVVAMNPSAGSVNVTVGGSTVATNLPYLGNTGYFSVRAGSEEVLIPNSTAPLDVTLHLNPDSKSTLFYDGWDHFESSWTILTDDNTPAPNSAKLRFMNASLGSGQDFYLLPPGSTPSGPPLASLAFNNATGYQVLAPGSYEIFVTRFQTPSQVLFDSGPITLGAGQNSTIVLLSNCQPTACNFDDLISLTLSDN
jgi:Domain of unknown function (DUF4397)